MWTIAAPSGVSDSFTGVQAKYSELAVGMRPYHDLPLRAYRSGTAVREAWRENIGAIARLVLKDRTGFFGKISNW
jgi:hypothetical protein